MRLTVPEPRIDLYKDGFAKHDQLGRKQTGDKLSNLVETIDDPLVIALDGAWGSGKSFFLKCWVGEHLKRHGHTTQTVYFDAFQHDYLTDPLVALTQTICDQLPPGSKTSRFIRKGKKMLSKVAMPSVRVAGAIATSGASEMVGTVADAAILSSWKEAERAAEQYWKREAGKCAAMGQFRAALQELTDPNENGEPQRKLVVVIDELDRCRPDYALSILEIIKHFFNVDGVHFVLGANLKELQNSVRARYGSAINAAKYLQKFVSLAVRLQGPKVGLGDQAAYSKHFDNIGDLIGLPNDWPRTFVRDYLIMSNHHLMISLRDVEKLACLLQVVPTGGIETSGERHVFAGLIIMEVTAPNLIEKARRGDLDYSDVEPLFLLETREEADGPFFDARAAWRATTPNPPSSLQIKISGRADRLFAQSNRSRIIPNMIAERMDAFVLPDAG